MVFFPETLMDKGDVAYSEWTDLGLKNAFPLVEVKFAHDYVTYSNIRHLDEQQPIRSSAQELRSRSSIHD